MTDEAADGLAVRLTVIDQPYLADLDGSALVQQGDQTITVTKEMAEDLALDLMKAYGLEWWLEPEDDLP